jgi:hypothetical protein
MVWAGFHTALLVSRNAFSLTIFLMRVASHTERVPTDASHDFEDDKASHALGYSSQLQQQQAGQVKMKSGIFLSLPGVTLRYIGLLDNLIIFSPPGAFEGSAPNNLLRRSQRSLLIISSAGTNVGSLRNVAHHRATSHNKQAVGSPASHNVM